MNGNIAIPVNIDVNIGGNNANIEDISIIGDNGNINVNIANIGLINAIIGVIIGINANIDVDSFLYFLLSINFGWYSFSWINIILYMDYTW